MIKLNGKHYITFGIIKSSAKCIEKERILLHRTDKIIKILHHRTGDECPTKGNGKASTKFINENKSFIFFVASVHR